MQSAPDPSRSSYYVNNALYQQVMESFSDWQRDDLAVADPAVRDHFRLLLEREARLLDQLRFDPYPGTFTIPSHPAGVTTVVGTNMAIALAGQVVSKMHIYYTGEDSGNPYVSFPKDSRTIDRTIAKFDDVVARIEGGNYKMRSRPEKLCVNCDMRAYCDAKIWEFGEGEG